MKMKKCRCTVSAAANMRGLLATVLVDKSGTLKLQVYNTSSSVMCLPAKMSAVRIFGVKHYEIERLPNEGVLAVEEERATSKRATGINEIQLKESLLKLHPEVFDLSTHKMTPAMKSLTVKACELPMPEKEIRGGKQCAYKIDAQVTDEAIKERLKDYEESGYIERVKLNESVFLSPLMPFQKPGRKEIRLVNDFRELNGYFPTKGRTQIDVRRVVDQIPADWKYYSVIDLKDGFCLAPLDRTLYRLFAFQFGAQRWVYKRLPQGFSFSPILFAERVAAIIEGTRAINFLDDLIVGGATPEEHHEALELVFRRLKKYGLKVNPQKMKLFRERVQFLRYTLEDGAWSLKEYLEDRTKQLGAIQTRKDLERHIGILSFARTQVVGIEVILKPLRRWLERVKTVKIDDDEWMEINEEVKKAYRVSLDCHTPLKLRTDFFDEFELYTDWTDHHIGYLLFGCDSSYGITKLIDIGSHVLCEKTSSFLGELRGILLSLQATKRLRGSVKTRVMSDNKAVVEKLQSGSTVIDDARVCRCWEYLLHNEENTTYSFIPGTENEGADGLSRLKTLAQGKESNRVCQLTSRPEEREIGRRVANAHFGHWSAKVTYQNLKMEGESWPRMREDVEDYVNKCPNCAYSGPAQFRDGPNEKVVTELGDRVHIDFTGPFFDKSYILVIVDEATRYVMTEHLYDTSAEGVTRKLEEWWQRVSPIKKICGDNATQWRSRYFQQWAATRQIEIILNPSYYHQGNSIVERAIQTLQNRIRRTLNGSREYWPAIVEAATHSMNESWHSAIRTCPKALALKINRNGELISDEEMTALWTEAIENQRRLKTYEVERFKWKHPFRSKALKIGERVLLRDPLYLSKPLKKLSPHWLGPYVIRK